MLNPSRLLALIYLVHDSRLLLDRHGDWVLVAVPMEPDLVTFLGDHLTLLWERLETVAGYEEGGLDVVFVEHLQQSFNSDRASEEASRNI